MKRWITLLLLLAMVSALLLTGNAAQSNLQVANVEVKPGETVYLKFELTQTTVGNAVGVAFEYDDTLLKPLKSSSTWAKKGILQDFDINERRGAWADTVAADLKGLVCTVAFEVIAQGHFETQVACMLIVKNGSEEVGTFTTSATVATFCDHEFGSWESIGEFGHTRTCKHCLRKQTQSHQWDDGKTTPMEGRPEMAVTTFTCQGCGVTKKIEHESDQKPTVPQETIPQETEPQFTWPTNPEHTDPTQPGFEDSFTFPTFPGFDNHPTVPTFPEQTYPTFPTQENHNTFPTMGDHGHDHATLPTQDAPEHDHGTTGNKTQSDNMLILLATVAVLGGLTWLFMRKKRK